VVSVSDLTVMPVMGMIVSLVSVPLHAIAAARANAPAPKAIPRARNATAAS
jgi:hypothetical protein